jgi:ribosome-associated protein
MVIRISRAIAIDESEIEERFARASGPGGQHVNRAATAVQLRFDVANSPALTQDVKDRLKLLAGNRLTEDGVLVIDAQRFRSQRRNRQDARRRLADLLRRAGQPPKVRRRTRPTQASKERRLRDKRKRSEAKKYRRRPGPSDD